jgi:hypothetical protein
MEFNSKQREGNKGQNSGIRGQSRDIFWLEQTQSTYTRSRSPGVNEMHPTSFPRHLSFRSSVMTIAYRKMITQQPPSLTILGEFLCRTDIVYSLSVEGRK